MFLARVVGSAVVTQKIPALMGKKLMIVQKVNRDGALIADNPDMIAVDSVGAGKGDLVIVAGGSAVRRLYPEPNEGIDNAITAIVDSLN